MDIKEIDSQVAGKRLPQWKRPAFFIIMFLSLLVISFVGVVLAHAFKNNLFEKPAFEIVSAQCSADKLAVLVRFNKDIVSTSTIEMAVSGNRENQFLADVHFQMNRPAVLNFTHSSSSDSLAYSLCIGEECKTSECNPGTAREAACFSLSDNISVCEADENCFFENGICLYADCDKYDQDKCQDYKVVKGNYQKCFWDLSTNACREKECADALEQKACLGIKHDKCFWQNDKCQDFSFSIADQACDDSSLIVAVKADKSATEKTLLTVLDSYSKENKNEPVEAEVAYETGKTELFKIKHDIFSGAVPYEMCVAGECRVAECPVSDDRYLKCLSLSSSQSSCELEFGCSFSEGLCGFTDCNKENLENCAKYENCAVDVNLKNCREAGCLDQLSREECLVFKDGGCVWDGSSCGEKSVSRLRENNISKTNYACTDTDFGRNYYVKGVATGMSRCIYDGVTQDCRREPTSYEDSCGKKEYGKESTVTDFFCDTDGRITGLAYKCAKGCVDGACVADPLEIKDIVIKDENSFVTFEIIANREILITVGEYPALYISSQKSGGAETMIGISNGGFSVKQASVSGSGYYDEESYRGDRIMTESGSYKFVVPSAKLLKNGGDKIFYWLAWGDFSHKSAAQRGEYALSAPIAATGN